MAAGIGVGKMKEADLFVRRERLKFLHIEGLSTYWVYAITDGEAIKFGFALDVSRRLRNLQMANHKKLTLLASIEVAKGTESAIHRALYAHRIRGEWFRISEETLRYVELFKGGDADGLYEYLSGWIDRIYPPALNVTR